MRKLLFFTAMIATFFISCSRDAEDIEVIYETNTIVPEPDNGDGGTIPDSESEGHHVEVESTFTLNGTDLTGYIVVQEGDVDFEDVSVSFFNENNELLATQYVILPETVNSNGDGMGVFSRTQFQINSENYNGGQITILFFVKTATTAGNWNRLLNVSSQYGHFVKVNVN